MLFNYYYHHLYYNYDLSYKGLYLLCKEEKLIVLFIYLLCGKCVYAYNNRTIIFRIFIITLILKTNTYNNLYIANVFLKYSC